MNWIQLNCNLDHKDCKLQRLKQFPKPSNQQANHFYHEKYCFLVAKYLLPSKTFLGKLISSNLSYHLKSLPKRKQAILKFCENLITKDSNTDSNKLPLFSAFILFTSKQALCPSLLILFLVGEPKTSSFSRMLNDCCNQRKLIYQQFVMILRDQW